ncbi:hypothetical protein [Nocardia sp. CS682]|uniref:alpha/beta hydrolase family protein n=1 Tax=Nocardia sp. CS682 TaxID=1047172 RepID=UPI00107569DD|nr:hypothetical protein [Nocardia sp. CS682]
MSQFGTKTLLTVALSLLVVPGSTAAAEDQIRRADTVVAREAATIWYPARSARRLPLALILPGANVGRGYYSRFAAAIAEYGFVVLVPERDLTSADNAPRGYGLVEALTWAREQAGDPASAVGARIDPTALVVAGHSYGGAAALFATTDRCRPPFCSAADYRRPPELKAFVGYGTNTSVGTEVEAVDVGGIPVMYVNGTEDGVSEPAEAYESFAKISGAPSAAYVHLLGANHFGLADIDNPPGAAPDPRPGTAPQHETATTAARWTASWFRAQLGDPVAREWVYTIGPRVDSAVRVEIR